MISCGKWAPLKLIAMVALPHETPLVMAGDHTANRFKRKLRQSPRDPISRPEQGRTPAKLEEQWTVCGLPQPRGGHRHWLSTRIRHGTLPATRHAVVGHDLLP